MATDPRTIDLTLEQKRRIAEIAEHTGRPWPEVLEEALKRATPTNGDTSHATGSRSFFDVLMEDGAIGVVKDGLPIDLSTNPKHMEGFGCDRQNGTD